MKKIHSQFLKNKDEIDQKKNWQWLQKGDLKGTTEALVCGAQEQTLRRHYFKYHID